MYIQIARGFLSIGEGVLVLVMHHQVWAEEKMVLSSPGIVEGKVIPVKYTCKGDNISPELRWQNVPPEAKSLMLLGEDPDAPSENHKRTFYPLMVSAGLVV